MSVICLVTTRSLCRVSTFMDWKSDYDYVLFICFLSLYVFSLIEAKGVCWRYRRLYQHNVGWQAESASTDGGYAFNCNCGHYCWSGCCWTFWDEYWHIALQFRYRGGDKGRKREILGNYFRDYFWLCDFIHNSHGLGEEKWVAAMMAQACILTSPKENWIDKVLQKRDRHAAWPYRCLKIHIHYLVCLPMLAT